MGLMLSSSDGSKSLSSLQAYSKSERYADGDCIKGLYKHAAVRVQWGGFRSPVYSLCNSIMALLLLQSETT